MYSLLFLTHIPLLRLESDVVPFGDGALFRMPFDSFNLLTMGAFADHQRDYDATAPVFYQVELDLDHPFIKPERSNQQAMQEMKISSDNFGFLDRLGLSFVRIFHEQFVDPAWGALLLAAPASALPAPRLSVIFVLPPVMPASTWGVA